ncbi:hypothetical protein CIT14_22075, partial [Virgibacillus profundi]
GPGGPQHRGLDADHRAGQPAARHPAAESAAAERRGHPGRSGAGPERRAHAGRARLADAAARLPVAAAAPCVPGGRVRAAPVAPWRFRAAAPAEPPAAVERPGTGPEPTLGRFGLPADRALLRRRLGQAGPGGL